MISDHANHDPDLLDRLAARAATGDREAFTEVMQVTAHGLRLFVTARLRSRALIDEVVQDTYVVAWERLATYQGPRCLPAWLKGIAHNHIRVALRDVSRTRAIDQDDLDVLLQAPDPQESESDTLSELVPHLATCLEQLDQRSRLLLERRYREDQPLATLAQHFKRNVRNLTMTLHRLRLALRTCIESQRPS